MGFLQQPDFSRRQEAERNWGASNMGFLRSGLYMFMIPIFLGFTIADPRTSLAGLYCNSTVAVSSDVLANNFVPAMDNLSSLVQQNGFGTTVVGVGANAVFGLAQCFKDLSSIDCRLCFSEIRSQLPKCYPKTGGRIFLDGCFGRYENFSFFNDATDAEQSKVCSFNSNSSEPVKFREAVNELIGNVTVEAEKNKGFAVYSSSSSNITVHALAQCWESLDTALCSSCLRAASSSILACTPAVEGRSLNAGCYLRYSTTIFWNLNLKASNSLGKIAKFWIIFGSLGGFIFLLVVGVLIWKIVVLKKSSGRSLRDMYRSGFSAAIARSNLNFRYDELKKATGNFNPLNKVGQGSYGIVYKGVLPDGREVAVKRLFLNTSQWIDQFFNEVDLINRVRHKNLVKLLGCSVDGPASLLVYEYHFNKSLDQFIFDSNRSKNLDWQKRFDIIQGVAEGLAYLHEESEIRIIHRDIKASNILLDEKLKPKITDFGLARSFGEDQTHLSTGIAGTLGYMAPEYVVHGHLTEKADVYSFGVLVLEIMTGKRCNSGIGSHAGQSFLAKIWSHYKANTIERLIDSSFYEERLNGEFVHVAHVGLLCTQATPSSRPTMVKVVELLRGNRDEREVLPTEPPFLDVIIAESNEEAEGSHLLLSTAAPRFSGSSEYQMHGR